MLRRVAPTISKLANARYAAAHARSKIEVQDKRKKFVNSALYLAYSNSDPLYLVRGEGCYLYDENGTAYLDTRNNVPHVGHCNKAVADAVCDQVRTLNTNTRYLHHNMPDLAEKLLKLFPKEIAEDSVVFFVNSGSEANDLALRLALEHSKKEGVVCFQHGYHGHTKTVIEASPYKFQSPRYQLAPPPHAHVLKQPLDKTSEAQGIEDMNKLFSSNDNIGAVIAESGMSIGGVLLFTPEYMNQLYDLAHSHGAVCIADEVQTGLGRLGDHWWAFEYCQVLPDIITVGKPIGNGMPLSAVVCRNHIAKTFAEGPDYFNTFGGNPVSCAAGVAVLNQIEELNLKQHALEVGKYLRDGLIELRNEFPDLIGEIRGQGLFLGVEFKSKQDKTQSGIPEASWIVTKLLDHNIIASLDGLNYNIMVIKPPMVFGKKECDMFLKALNSCFQELKSSPYSKIELQTKTPT